MGVETLHAQRQEAQALRRCSADRDVRWCWTQHSYSGNTESIQSELELELVKNLAGTGKGRELSRGEAHTQSVRLAAGVGLPKES